MLKILGYIFLLPVKLYQWVISPLFPATCRHTPTCSSYTEEAVKVWGPFKGIWLGLKRFSKCHPWGTSGYDPVPHKHNEDCKHHIKTKKASYAKN